MLHKFVACLLAAVLLCAGLAAPLQAPGDQADTALAVALADADSNGPCEPRCDQDDRSDDLATQPHADPLQDTTALIDSSRVTRDGATADPGPDRWRSAMHLAPCLAGPQRPPCIA